MRKPRPKPLTNKSPETYVCQDCLGGFMAMRPPSYCPFCAEPFESGDSR